MLPWKLDIQKVVYKEESEKKVGLWGLVGKMSSNLS